MGALVAIAVLGVCWPVLRAQSSAPTLDRGQNIAPAYEGWLRNADGTYDLVFGYMNRNWEERLHLPVGVDNRFEPGEADRGQPTFFLPRRNFFVFRVRVPAGFGDGELVWSLTAHGRTERAYGTLRPGYALSDDVMTATLGAVGPGVTTSEVSRSNRPPSVVVEGDTTRRTHVGAPITLDARATDDGIPRSVPLPGFLGSPLSSAQGVLLSVAGLRVAWFVYRGDGAAVTFDPPQFKVWVDPRGGSPWSPGWLPPPVPAGNRWRVRATFAKDGEYVLRCLAHDGGLAAVADVRVVVE